MGIDELTPKERKVLAGRLGTDPQYLYQLGSGRGFASPALAKRMMAAEPRLTWDGIYKHVPEPEQAAA